MRLRIALTTFILGAFGVLHGFGATQSWVGSWMQICSGVFALGYFAAAILLWRRAFWARWLTQGIAVVGLLNCAAFFALLGADQIFVSMPWLIGGQAIGFVALLALTAGRSMRTEFDEKPSPHNRWRFDSKAVKLLRVAVVLNFAALPMIFKYIGSAHCPLSVGALTVLLGVALGLVILQRTAGILLLAVSGVLTAMLALSAGGTLMQMLTHRPEFMCGTGAWRYSIELVERAMMSSGFVPGALAAIAALAVFAAPMARFLRRGR
ncbi:MAG: hypothetical protein KC503_20080 [Myxococcales bacterium]|nr:hypothetical protein [Myxococcales bacterium]